MSWYESSSGELVWISREETVYTVVQPAEDLPTEELMYLSVSTQKAQFQEHTCEDDLYDGKNRKKTGRSGRQRGFLVRVEVDENLRVVSWFKAACAELQRSVCSKVDPEECRNAKVKRRNEKVAIGANECRIETVGRCNHVACGPGFRVEVTEGSARQRICFFTRGKTLSVTEWHAALVAAIEETGSRVMLARRLGEKPENADADSQEVMTLNKRDKAHSDEEAWFQTAILDCTDEERRPPPTAPPPAPPQAKAQPSKAADDSTDAWFAKRMGSDSSSRASKAGAEQAHPRTERAARIMNEWGLFGSHAGEAQLEQRGSPPQTRARGKGSKGSSGSDSSKGTGKAPNGKSDRSSTEPAPSKGSSKGVAKAGHGKGERSSAASSRSAATAAFLDPEIAQMEEDRRLAQLLQEEEWRSTGSWADTLNQRATGQIAAKAPAWSPSLRPPPTSAVSSQSAPAYPSSNAVPSSQRRGTPHAQGAATEPSSSASREGQSAGSALLGLLKGPDADDAHQGWKPEWQWRSSDDTHQSWNSDEWHWSSSGRTEWHSSTGGYEDAEAKPSGKGGRWRGGAGTRSGSGKGPGARGRR